MAHSTRHSIKSLRLTANHGASSPPVYTSKQIADPAKKHKFVWETTVSWNGGALQATAHFPGKEHSKRKAAVSMLSMLREHGVYIIPGVSTPPASVQNNQATPPPSNNPLNSSKSHSTDSVIDIQSLDPAQSKPNSNPFARSDVNPNPAHSSISTQKFNSSNASMLKNPFFREHGREKQAANSVSSTPTTTTASNAFAASKLTGSINSTASTATSTTIAPKDAQKSDSINENSSNLFPYAKANGYDNSPVLNNPFLPTDGAKKEATISASSITAASDAVATFKLDYGMEPRPNSRAVHSDKVGIDSSSSTLAKPPNPFLNASRGGVKFDLGAKVGSSPIRSNPFANPANNDGKSTTPSLSVASPNLTGQKSIKRDTNEDNSAAATSTLPKTAAEGSSNKHKASSSEDNKSKILTVVSATKSTVAPNGFKKPDSNIVDVRSTNAIVSHLTTKDRKPSREAWKPNPRAAEFIPGQPSFVMENKVNDVLAQKRVPDNSPRLAEFAPPLNPPLALPGVNEPRNMTAPSDMRIPNAFWVTPPPPPSNPTPSVGNVNPMATNSSWNPFSGVGNVLNHCPILATPTPTSGSTTSSAQPTTSEINPPNPLPKAPIGTPVKANTTSPKASSTRDLTKPAGSAPSKPLAATASSPHAKKMEGADQSATSDNTTNLFTTSNEYKVNPPANITNANPFVVTKQSAPETKANDKRKASELTAANLKLHENRTKGEANRVNNERKFCIRETMHEDSRGTRAFDLSFGQPSPGAPPQHPSYLNSASSLQAPHNAKSKTNYQYQPQLHITTTGTACNPSMATVKNIPRGNTSRERSPSLASSGKASHSSKKVQSNPFAKPNSSNKRSTSASIKTADAEGVTPDSVAQNYKPVATTANGIAATKNNKNLNPFAASLPLKKKSKNANDTFTVANENSDNNTKTHPPAANKTHKRAFNATSTKIGNGGLATEPKNNAHTTASITSTTAQNGSVLGMKNMKAHAAQNTRAPNGTWAAKDESESSKKGLESVSTAAASKAEKKTYVFNPNAAVFQKSAPLGDKNPAHKPSDTRLVDPIAKPYTRKPFSSALAIVKPPSSAASVGSPAQDASCANGATDTLGPAVKNSESKTQFILTHNIAVDNNPNKTKSDYTSSSALIDTGSVEVNGVQKRVIIAPHVPGVAKEAPRNLVHNSSAVSRVSQEKQVKPIVPAAPAVKPQGNGSSAKAIIVQKAKDTAVLAPKAKPAAPVFASTKNTYLPNGTASIANNDISSALKEKCNGLEMARKPVKLWIFGDGQEANLRKTLLQLDIPGDQVLETNFDLVYNTRIPSNALRCQIAAKAAVKAYALKMERFINIEADNTLATENNNNITSMDHKVIIVSTSDDIEQYYGKQLGNVQVVQAKNLNHYIATLYK